MTEEEKAAAAKAASDEAKKKERESITVDVVKHEETEENKDETNKEEKVENKEVENKEEIAANEKTQEELEAEKAAATTTKDKEKVQKRIDKLTAKTKTLEDENKELKRKLEAKPDAEKVLTEEDVNARAETLATQKQLEREFANACNKLAADATKADKDFPTKVEALGKEVGPIPSVMIGVLEDLENGGEVLAYLADNQDEAEEIFPMSAARMAVRLAKIAGQIEVDKKAKAKKPISKVPDPTEPINGGVKTPIVLSDKDPMDEWVRKRNRQVAERKEAKARGM